VEQHYLTRLELSRRWNRTYGTLSNWALGEKGPKPIRFSNGRVRYLLTDVEAYEAKHEMST
jgi:hypothetical protein